MTRMLIYDVSSFMIGTNDDLFVLKHCRRLLSALPTAFRIMGRHARGTQPIKRHHQRKPERTTLRDTRPHLRHRLEPVRDLLRQRCGGGQDKWQRPSTAGPPKFGRGERHLRHPAALRLAGERLSHQRMEGSLTLLEHKTAFVY